MALAIFLPLLGAFIAVWLCHRSTSLSLAVSRLFLLGGLAALVFLTVEMGVWDRGGLTSTAVLHTGIMAPPLSIDLQVSGWSAIAALVVYAGALIGIGRLSGRNPRTQPLLLSLVTASLGLMFATDMFNSFVFIEIGSIITIGLTAACRCRRRWEVAVKVALVSGLVTILYLMAVVVVYRTTGELRLLALRSTSGFPALLVSGLLLTVIMTEIKAFPLSGWGLDLYEGAGQGFAGVYAATWSLAVLVWSARVLPLLPLPDIRLLAWLGGGGLVLGQLAGMRQSDPGRIMGYSTAAYASLLLVLAGTVTGNDYLALTLILLVFAAISKLAVFMMAGPREGDAWSGARGLLLLLPLLCIIGIPPLPVFWAKIRLLTIMSGTSPVLFWLVITGLLFEAVYILRLWAGRSAPMEKRSLSPTVLSASLLLLAGTVWLVTAWGHGLSLSGTLLPSPLLRHIFVAIFAGGTLLALPGAFRRSTEERSYWSWMLISGAALTLLPLSGNSLTFYVLWEISAFAAVIGVSRGRASREGTFWFSVFAAAAGFLLLASIVISGGPLASPGLPMVLIAAAALIKMGQAGTHLWTVRAYSAAPSTLPAFLSGSSSKAAVLLLAMAGMGASADLASGGQLLAWIGALGALGMAVMASLESDYRRVLAYASVSQLGYVLVGLGLVSVMGWTAAFYHTLHHFLFKTVLFLGAAGVILRTGTSSYDRLGGLVKRMPLTFTFTLISVIAFAGVPPLAGFGGKWLLYNALVEAGMLPVALVAMFASVVAFLYAFRLLYAVFLGQLSGAYSRVREAPLVLLLPQGILTAAVMVLSFRPTLLLDRLVPGLTSVTGLGGGVPVLEGTSVVTSLGSWDAWSVGMMVMGLFGFAFVFYWISGRKPTHVGQLDIGFAGELPPSPEEIHYAGDFYRPYRRALSFLPRIHAGRLFGGFTRLLGAAGDAMRALFTGDARTYLAHSLVFLVLLLFWLRGVTG